MMTDINNIGGPPPAPRPEQRPSSSSDGILSAPAIPLPRVMPWQQAAPVPAPTHAETVAALRHFHEIQTKLRILLNDPALGKANLKSRIIDGMTELVRDRIVTPSAAVAQLADVPDTPFQQRRWLQQHYMQSIFAQAKVLGDHANAWGGTPDHMIDKRSLPDDHLSHMSSIAGHYGVARA